MILMGKYAVLNEIESELFNYLTLLMNDRQDCDIMMSIDFNSGISFNSAYPLPHFQTPEIVQDVTLFNDLR